MPNPGLVVVLSVMVALGACSKKKPSRWHGFVYPDKSDRRRYIDLGEYATREECDAAAWARRPDNDGGDYACGLNCRFDKDMRIYVCQETW